jgi:hypothetical protein
VNVNQPIIGNDYDAQIRSFSTPPGGDSFFGGGYPGLGGGGEGYSEFPQAGGLPVPYEGGGLVGAGTPASTNPLSGINFQQIKTFVDRMGGVDGVIGAMTKAQKFFGTFQQMAPMFKVLFNSFGSKVKSTDRDFRGPQSRRRRRRRKSGSTANKGTGSRRTRK